MKLQQNQTWQAGDRCFRIVELDRMSVRYKLLPDCSKNDGAHHRATKKEFCRLLRGATLLSPPRAG